MNYEELAAKIIERFKEKTAKKSVEMTFTNKEAGITNSKLSGVPFIPVGGEYPVEKETGKKLFLLVQINFAEMPALPDYPTEGILQIFIADDDLYGCDFDDEQSQDKWRIIYHENISNPMPKDEIIEMMPKMDDDYLLPFEKPGMEYLIEFEEVDALLSLNDVRMENMFDELCDDILTDDLKGQGFYDFPDELIELLEDELDGSGSHLGGYPTFTQTDPREYDMPKTCELLLQIDSDGDADGDWALMWGDSGVANFFIEPEDLKKRDFTKVYYNWDCC